MYRKNISFITNNCYFGTKFKFNGIPETLMSKFGRE